MNRTLTPLAAACLLALFSVSAQASAYSSMVVFGDSLSDAGQRPQVGALTNPSRHTNAIGPTYAVGELFGSTSPMLINDGLGLAPQVASTNAVRAAMGQPDGDNWAVGGYTTAQVYESIVGTHNTATGYGGSEVRAGLTPADALIRGRDGYLPSLAAQGLSVDPSALFYINGGGNDFLQGLILDTASAEASAIRMGDSMRVLQAAGAQNFMMPLLVDVENPATNPNTIPFMLARSQEYNAELVRQMASINANVIPLNVPMLYQEVLANPGMYGFDATQNLVGTCFSGCGTVNTTWGLGSATPDPSKLLYADAVHPTTAMHRILADQALSILSAPWQVSLLPEMANASLRSAQDVVRNQQSADWGHWQAVGQWRGYAGAGGQRQNFHAADTSASGDGNGYGLNAGASYRLSDTWRVGLALALQQQELEAGSADSEFDLRSYIATGFAQYHDGLVWGDAHLSAGYLDYDDLKRKFAMGITTRSESGDSTGYVLAAGGRLGVELGVSDPALKISPFISADYAYIRVDGYGESGASSTALSYGDQTRKSERLGLGVQVRYDFTEQTAVYGELHTEKEFNDDRNDLRMQLNSVSAVGFKLKGYDPEDRLTRFSLGLKQQLAPNLALQAGYNYRHAANDNLHGAQLSVVYDW